MTRDGTLVRPVRDGASHRAFWTLPWRLYRDDPNWVAPLRLQESRRWSARHNPSLLGRRVERFVAMRQGRPVGRVVVSDDPGFAARWSPGAGFFGFFEAEDDPATARALLAAAGDVARSWGLSHLLGPVSLTTNDEVGLLVDGFGTPPMLLSPYNPPYYRRLLEEAGLTTERDYHSFRWSPDTALSPAAERAIRWAAASDPPVTIRSADPSSWDRDRRLMHRMYDACFADLWGFVPLTEAEFDQRAEEFRTFYRPQLALFAERGGETIGFTLALPDINEVLRRMNGRLFPLGWLTLLRGMRQIRTARAILVGVRPAWRGTGTAILLAHRLAEAGRRIGITSGEISIVQVANRRMAAVARGVGGVPAKTYRLYRLTLEPEA